MKYYKEWADSYKKTMKVAKRAISSWSFSAPVESYCGNEYRGINSFLRNETDCETNRYREMADILSIVLCLAPRIPENIVVYRLVDDNFIAEFMEETIKYGMFQEKGFMSTSLLENIVNVDEYFASEHNLLKIYVKSGTIGIYVNSVVDRSEEEVLLFPNRILILRKPPYNSRKLRKVVYECDLYESFE